MSNLDVEAQRLAGEIAVACAVAAWESPDGQRTEVAHSMAAHLRAQAELPEDLRLDFWGEVMRLLGAGIRMAKSWHAGDPSSAEEMSDVVDRDRFVCPFCSRDVIGPFDMCGGGLLDADHPTVVRPVFVPAGEDADRIRAEARARYG